MALAIVMGTVLAVAIVMGTGIVTRFLIELSCIFTISVHVEDSNNYVNNPGTKEATKTGVRPLKSSSNNTLES